MSRVGDVFYGTYVELLRMLAEAAKKAPDGRIHWTAIEALAAGLEQEHAQRKESGDA